MLLSLSLPAQADPERLEDCHHLAWAYTPDPRLLAFHLYVSQTSGSYDWTQPIASVVALPELVLEIPCGEIYLPGEGIYYAVLRAISLSGTEDSEPSAEIRFTYGSTGPLPDPPPIPPPPPTILPPRPPPPKGPEPPPVPFPPPTAGTITETCAYKGTCAGGWATRPPPPFPFPPELSTGTAGSLPESCQWRGTCR